MASDSQTFVALNYLARDPKYEEQKPFTCYIDLSTVTQAETSNLVTETIENIPVVNVRGQNHDLQLDQQGFEVVNLGQSFQAADFQDQQWMQDIYYPFISRYLVDKLGAKEAHVFEHQVEESLLFSSLHLLCTKKANYVIVTSFVTDIRASETAS